MLGKWPRDLYGPCRYVGLPTKPLQEVGDPPGRVCSGESYYRIGYSGQGPGKLAYVAGYHSALPQEEIVQIYKDSKSSFPGFLVRPPLMCIIT
jgi:hypothetical protein